MKKYALEKSKGERYNSIASVLILSPKKHRDLCISIEG